MSLRNFSGKYRCRLHPPLWKCVCKFLWNFNGTAPRLVSSAWPQHRRSYGVFKSWIFVTLSFPTKNGEFYVGSSTFGSFSLFKQEFPGVPMRWRTARAWISNVRSPVYRQSQVWMPNGSGVKWAECLLIIGTGCRVQVFCLILDSSVGLSAGIQSAGDLVLETLWVWILHSAEDDNLSPFDSKIACLCQSIKISKNKWLLN